MRLAERELQSESLFLRTDFWRSLHLPVRDLLGLVRTLAPLASEWGWRSKDWGSDLDEFDRDVERAARHDYADLAYVLVRTHPDDTLPELASWLNDGRALVRAERGTKVRDVGMGVLFRLFRAHEEDVWRTLADSWPSGAIVVNYLVEEHAALLADCATTYETETPDEMLAHLLSLPDMFSQPASSQDLLAVLQRLYDRTTDPALKRSALTSLVEHSDDPRWVGLAAESLARGESSVYVGSLPRAPAARPDVLLVALASAVESGVHHDDVLSAVAEIARPGPLAAECDAVVSAHLRSHPGPPNMRDGHYVEVRLGTSEHATPALIELTRIVISTGDRNALSSVAYGLASPRSLTDDPSTRLLLLDDLRNAVVATGDDARMRDVVDICAKFVSSTPQLEGPIWSLVEQMGPEAADKTIIANATSYAAFARAAARWLADHEPPGRWTRRFSDSLKAGDDPSAAASRALDAGD